MTYTAGSNILAADYNAFSTLANGMNEIYGDLYPGATTLPNAAFGYGKTPVLTAVAAGQDVTAAQWASLFQIMRDCGSHQGVSVTPPVPVLNPVAGNTLVAENAGNPLSVSVLNLRVNRLNISPGQSVAVANMGGSPVAQPGGASPWTNTLTWNYQVNLTSWNNARYFFNLGGSLNLSGSYAPIITPEDSQWASMFTTMSPLLFRSTSTAPNSGTGGTAIGFYGLTTTYQNIYFKTYGSGYYYVNSSITVQAKLNAAAGTNGLIDFRIILTDADPSPNSKSTVTTYALGYTRSGGTVPFSGTLPTFTTVGGNSGFVAT